MIVRDHPALSLSRQCRLLSLGRSSLYYTPKGESAETLLLMRRIDELFLKYPCLRRPSNGASSAPRGRADRPTPGRSADAPDGASGNLSGAAHQRSAPRAPDLALICCGAWRSSGRTMSGAPISPISRCSAASFTWWRSWTGQAGSSWPGVCRTHWTQASAQTRSTRPWPGMASRRYSTPTRAASSRASPSPGACRRPASGSRWMAGAGAWTTSSSSGLWRSLKYEPIYLHEIADGLIAARRLIRDWVRFYNVERPHSALDGRTPAEAYRRRAACGYDGQAAPRLAHIPTGATAATGRSFMKGILAA